MATQHEPLVQLQPEFTPEQKNYLQGFVSGNDLARNARGLPTFAGTVLRLGLPPGSNAGPLADAPLSGTKSLPEAPQVDTSQGPEAIHIAAQNRVLAEGRKLTEQEAAKRRKHPLDQWDDIANHAKAGQFPKGTDVLAFKYHGLFYVAPTQDSYMCRLRFHGGLVSAAQMRALAGIAAQYAGGYADVTTRANLQLREIAAANGLETLTALQEAGIVTRGAGADNIRNITGPPTAGIDPQELIDTRPLTRAMHFHILNHREMYGLPRKFNIAFDGGGTVSVLEDTNDIGFVAVRVAEGKAAPEGVYFRMQLGGITGHEDFARDCGVLLRPDECVPMAAAVVRVFIEHGDRTDRKKARLKYLLDRWGQEKFMAEAIKHLGYEPQRLPLAECLPRGPVAKHAHVGIHPQKQDGLFYIGVLLPVGRIRAAQMAGLAALSERYGSGSLRLTVWQNLLMADIRESDVQTVRAEIEALGLRCDASNARGGLVACTGNAGCKFAASDTKRHALEVADYLDGRLQLDQPVNLHFTGCPNSCAQHYIGDIGFLGTQVEIGDDGDTIEGYHVYVGGGYGHEQGIGREVFQSVPAEDTPRLVEHMLRAYLEDRAAPEESFIAWSKRYPVETLKELFEAQAAVAA